MSISKELKPYISVTGVTNLEEAQSIAQIFHTSIGPTHSHQGAVGYLVNLESLNGSLRGNQKRPNLSDLPDLLSETAKDTENIIHYNTKKRGSLAEQVIRLFKEGDIYTSGLSKTVQINTRWPNVNQLQTIKDTLPDLRIILALGKKTLRTQRREEILKQLESYQPLIDFILIDPSGGTKYSFEAGWVAPYYRGLRDTFPDKQIILAGGFNAEAITSRLAEITYAILDDNFGIDAESGLREISATNPYGTLSLPKVALYVQKTAAFFSM